jgi:type II secretory pathway component PulJ
LIELMIAMAIATLLLSAVYAVYASLSRSYTTQNVAAEVQQTVRAAIDFMAEDIMMAGLDPQLSAGATFEAASDTNIRFTLDRNFNGSIDDIDEERVTYSLNGTDLRQGLYEGTASQTWETLISHVTAFSLSYLDADGNPIASPVSAVNLSDIRAVIIQISVQEPAGRGDPVAREYNINIRCRNLGI